MNKKIFVIRFKNLEDYKYVKSIALSYGYKLICSGPGYNALYFDKNKRTMENSLSLLEAKYIEDTFYFDEDNLAIMEKLREGWVKFDVPKNGEVYENFNDKSFAVTGSFTVDKNNLNKNNLKKQGNMKTDNFAVIFKNPEDSKFIQGKAFLCGYGWFYPKSKDVFNHIDSKILFFFKDKQEISNCLGIYDVMDKIFIYEKDYWAILDEFKKEKDYELGVTIKGEKLCLIKREPMGGGKTEYKLKAGCSKEYDIEDFYLLYNWLNDGEKLGNIFRHINTCYLMPEEKYGNENLHVHFMYNEESITIPYMEIKEIKKQIDKYLNKVDGYNAHRSYETVKNPRKCAKIRPEKK